MKFSGSFRVDDFVPDGQWYSKFINSRLWYERPEYRIEGNCNWDYSKPQVRDFFLGAMRELVERYEIDGLELDFCNNGPFYPKDLPDQEKFMTEFMRNLRETTHRVGAKRERPIMLSAMIRTRNFGAEIAWDAAGSRLDLETWCRERLIDRLEPTFFAAEDQIEADAQAFLEMARGSNVELYAQVQARRRAEPRLARTQADFSALEEKCRVLGFDGVHYMNYFVYRGVNHPGREFRSLNVRYTADELPTTAANIWIEDRTAAGPVELANGVLHLRGPVAYQRDPAMLSSGNRELTVEVRVKVGSAKGERFCGLSVANGQRQVMIDLGPDCLAVYEGEKLLNTIKTDLTKFRTIRLTLTGGHVANIYLDASSDPVISTPLSQAAKHWQVRWGNLTTEPLAESYWDALHYTLDGAYGPGDRVRVGSVKATVQSFEAAGVSGPSGVEHSAARSQLFSKRRARSRTTRAALVL
jgi:hypothetical protein